MKLISLFFCLFGAASAISSPKTFAVNRAVEIRGGGALGPIDEELVNKLSTLVTSAYVASAGQKYISGATGVASAGVSHNILYYVDESVLFIHSIFPSHMCYSIYSSSF